MLTQEAANLTHLVAQDGTEKILSASICTWSNDWKYIDVDGKLIQETDPDFKIWRKHRNYLWKGDLNADGSYAGYTAEFDGFEWGLSATPEDQPDEWQMISETSLYDYFSMPLETKDINGNRASSKMTDSQTKISSVSNAAYGEQFYTGAESDWVSGSIYIEPQIWGKTYRTDEYAHTGEYSLRVPNSVSSTSDYLGVLLKGGQHRAGTYKLSVWAHRDNYEKLRFKLGLNGASEPFSGEKVFAGDWVQLNHYIERSAAEIQNDQGLLIVKEGSENVFIDDIRLHPVQSSMTSYVYNDWNELTHILGGNNMATRYEYDDGGKLKSVYSEVVDNRALQGGFKLSKEYYQNYKRNLSTVGDVDGDQDDNLFPVYFSNLNSDQSVEASSAILNGPPYTQVTLSLNVNGPLSNQINAYSYVFGTVGYGSYTQIVEIPAEGYREVNVQFLKAPFDYGQYCQQCDGSATISITASSIGTTPSTNGDGTFLVFSDQDNESCCPGVGGPYAVCSPCEGGLGEGDGDGDDGPSPITASPQLMDNGNYLENGICQGEQGARVQNVGGGSGSYNYSWKMSLGSSEFQNIAGTGSSVIYSYSTQSGDCSKSIRFRCIISDPQGTVPSRSFTTQNGFNLDCDCEQN